METNNRQPCIEGVGLSLDEVRTLLAQKGFTVSPDDPILMLVTIFNAYLVEEQKMLDRHNTALISILSARTDEYINNIKKTTTNLNDCLSETSLQTIEQTITDHNHKQEKNKILLIGMTVIITISALLNVAIFVLGLLK